MRSPSRPRSRRSQLAAVLSLCCAASALAAATAPGQELRGAVLTPDGALPASGVVVVMLHATRDDSIVARTVTSERGRFSLKPPAGMPTRLRLLRIGYVPMEAGRFTLAAGEVRDTSLTLSNVRVQLATVRVRDNARCAVRPDGALRVAQLFDAVRTALIASTATVSGTSSRSEYVNFNRYQDKDGRIVSPVSRKPGSGTTLKAFQSIGADTLARRGYVIADGDGATYYAPDADVLLSELFLTQHCLMLVEGTGAMAPYVGIGFRPVARRNGLVDVRGTFWVDRTSFELQFLEYEYEGLPVVTRSAGLGGRVEYARMANGGWFVSNWAIRMPMIERIQTSVPAGPYGTQVVRTIETVVGQQVTGGEVQTIRVDDNVLYLNTHAALAGQMPQDSVRVVATSPSGGAAPSPFTDRASVARMDSAAVTSVCGLRKEQALGGLALGRVLDPNRNAVTDVVVRAEWQGEFFKTGPIIRFTNMTAEALPKASGNYELCGLQFDRSVTISALRGERRLRAAVLRVTDQQPAAWLDFSVPAKPNQQH